MQQVMIESYHTHWERWSSDKLILDFNPLAIEEWRQWLQNTGIYGPGGDFFDK
jgi:hypothetical protein